MSEQNPPQEQRESPAQNGADSQRDDEYHESEVRGSTQRTTRTDVDVEDNPPEPDEPKEKSMDRDDDEGFISFEDVTYKRDEGGELVPVENYVEELEGWTKALPMTIQHRSHIEDFQDRDSDVDELSDSWLADLFESRLIEPDLTQHPRSESGRITERFVREEMSQHNQMGCLYSILMASDEWQLLRLFRGDLNENEMEMAMRLQEQQNGEGGQGNRRARNR